MATLPLRQIGEAIKKYAPKAGKFAIKHWKEITVSVGTVGKSVEKYNKYRENRKENKQLPYRKERNIYYKSQILRDLDNKNRNDLFQYKLEIEQFIQQIKGEEKDGIKFKKTILSHEIKDWNELLIAIEDKMYARDYLEYLKIYNDPNYISEYFKGFENLVQKFKKLIDTEQTEEFFNFIFLHTKRSIEQIRRDFSL